MTMVSAAQVLSVASPLPGKGRGTLSRAKSCRSAVDTPAVPEHVREIVRYACLAPSKGNAQPWSFFYDEGDVWVVRDPVRSSMSLDAGDAGVLLALGAAVENAVVAAAYAGYRVDVEWCPLDAGHAVARLELAPDPGADARLYPFLAQRVTNRRPSKGQPLPQAFAAPLEQAAAARGARLEMITGPDEVSRLADLVGRAERLRVLHPDLHRDLISEVRWTPEEALATRDGVTLPQLELSSDGEAAWQLLRRPEVVAALGELDLGASIEEMASLTVAHSGAVGLLTVPGDETVDWLTAGRALERTWLEATRLGLALHPVSSPVFLARMLSTGLRHLYSAAEAVHVQRLADHVLRCFPNSRGRTPAMLFRLSRPDAPPTERALRRPLRAVLRTGRPF